MKKCKQCNEEKELSEYYKHKQMADGYLSICKECKKADARSYHRKNAKTIAEYKASEAYRKKARIRDQKRNGTPKRRRAAAEYHTKNKNNPDYKAARKKVLKEYETKYPERIKANRYLNNAIRSEKIFRPDHCQCCKAACVPHGHHWSYLEEHWLDVEWLCAICHKAEHKE